MTNQPTHSFSSFTGDDTIAAFATAVGGAVAILRISGGQAVDIAQQVWRGNRPLGEKPFRSLLLGSVQADAGILDGEVLAVYMPGPHSFTGEDVVELHCHGGALSARVILRELLRAGCRHADPGEFTRRAFINGRVDLTQAEAVADLINAHSEAALHLANRQLGGLLGRRINQIHDQLSDLLAEIEARLDFPEEDLDWRSAEDLQRGFAEAEKECCALLASRREGEILRQGVRLVLAGAPNVGKSSLLNAILGRDRAIVTNIPGTTRDTLEEFAHIRGIPVHLVDTAGLRDTEDPIEKSGVERSRSSIRGAEVVLWIHDASQPLDEEALDKLRTEFSGTVITVANKADLNADTPTEAIPTCALTGSGLEALFDAIEKAVWNAPHTRESEIAVSSRHAQLMEQALEAIREARGNAETMLWELAAIPLHEAIEALGLITGRSVSPDVLETIFSRFCIGK